MTKRPSRRARPRRQRANRGRTGGKQGQDRRPGRRIAGRSAGQADRIARKAQGKRQALRSPAALGRRVRALWAWARAWATACCTGAAFGCLCARRRADQRRNRPGIGRKQAGRMGGKCVTSTCGRRRRSGHCVSARGAPGGCAPSILNDVRHFGLWGKVGPMVCGHCLAALWSLFGASGGMMASVRIVPSSPPYPLFICNST